MYSEAGFWIFCDFENWHCTEDHKPINMAYKPNQGTSLQERFRQMSEQERLIQQKKAEIEQKMIQQKLKVQEDAMNKMAGKSKLKDGSEPSTATFTGNKL